MLSDDDDDAVRVLLEPALFERWWIEKLDVECSRADEILVSPGVEVTGSVQLTCECEDESCETRLFKSDTYVLMSSKIISNLTDTSNTGTIRTRSYVCLRSVALVRQLLEVSMIRVRGIVPKKLVLDA